LRNLTRLNRWSQILIVAGILSILTATWTNRPTIWRPLAVDASATAADAADVHLIAGLEYEVSVEFERRLPVAAAGPLAAKEPQSTIAAQWAIACDGEQIAAGNLADYIRIDIVRSWRGELYRLVARVPFGLDEAKYWGFGLAGRYLSERVVGAFQVPDNARGACEFSSVIERPADNARIAVRRTGLDWRKHDRQLALLPIGGVLAVSLGLFGILLRGLILLRSRRDDPPATRS
jgi:hypothetical protein